MTSELKQTGKAAFDADRRATVESSASPDRAETGRQHFEVLDGLRGSAAIMVALFHVMGMAV
jgi:hypothetical protein